MRGLDAQQLSSAAGAAGDALECRKMVSKVVISSSQPDARVAFQRIQFPSLADTFAPGGEQFRTGAGVSQSAYLVFNKRNRELDQHLLVYRARRLVAKD